jgi:light-regulated signal transduction histidine kinase (bacteriophytochrome)
VSAASDARRQRRALKRAGVEYLDRVSIESSALAAAVTKGANLVDLVAYHVAGSLERLDAQGADIVAGHTVISIGAHPDYPGDVTIEAKAATRKSPAPLEDDDDESAGGMLAGD